MAELEPIQKICQNCIDFIQRSPYGGVGDAGTCKSAATRFSWSRARWTPMQAMQEHPDKTVDRFCFIPKKALEKTTFLESISEAVIDPFGLDPVIADLA